MRKNVNSLVFCDTLYAGQADTCPDCNQASHPSRPGHSANTAGFKPEKTSGSMETGNNKTRKYDPLARIWKNYPPDPAQLKKPDNSVGMKYKKYVLIYIRCYR